MGLNLKFILLKIKINAFNVGNSNSVSNMPRPSWAWKLAWSWCPLTLLNIIALQDESAPCERLNSTVTTAYIPWLCVLNRSHPFPTLRALCHIYVGKSMTLRKQVGFFLLLIFRPKVGSAPQLTGEEVCGKCKCKKKMSNTFGTKI